MITCLSQCVVYLVISVGASVWIFLPQDANNLDELVGPNSSTVYWRGFGQWPLPMKGTECFLKAPNATTTGARILVPAPPKTGSTSMQFALQALGYRTYKMEDYVFFMGPVFRALATGKTGTISGGELPSLVASLRGCGVEAIFTDALDIIVPFPELYRATPGAKVILTERAFEVTHKSIFGFAKFLNGKNKLGNVMYGGYRALPWHPLLWSLGLGLEDLLAEGGPEIVRKVPKPSGPWVQFWYFTYTANVVWDIMIDAVWPFLVDVMDKRETFDQHFNLVKEMVPPEDLLLFDVKKHGWKELADFLGTEVPQGAFPSARNLAESGDVVAGTDKRWRDLAALLGLAVHLINFVLLRLVWNTVVGLFSPKASDKTKQQ